jgi:RHS repeat-associated protein
MLGNEDRVGSRGKYFPYGEERNSPALPNDNVKFATYTRDAATGLDYADQRYYAATYSRFLSPDPYDPSADTRIPKSWNRYAYAAADPVNLFDPLGLAPCGATTVQNGSVITVTVTDCIGLTGGGSFPLPLGLVAPFYIVPAHTQAPTVTLVDWDDVHPRKCPSLPKLPPGIGAGQIQAMVNEATAYLNTQLYHDPENVGTDLIAFLMSKFLPGGDWDYKHNYQPGSTDYKNAMTFGNFAFGSVMEGLGLTYIEGQNAAGGAQILICLAGGSCGQGFPVVEFPFGDQAEDAAEVERGYAYQRKYQAGCQP